MALSLYETIFEGKKEKVCGNCIHFSECETYFTLTGEKKDDKPCDIYEEENGSLFDEIFGKEEQQ